MLLRDVFDIRGQGDLLQDIFANFDWNRRGSSEARTESVLRVSKWALFGQICV